MLLVGNGYVITECMTKKDYDEIFTLMDFDKDGIINYQDFKQGFNELMERVRIEIENDNLLNYGCLFLFLSSINSFFIESTIKNKKIIYITITTIISIIFTIFINEGYEYIQKLSIFYIVSLPLIGIYSNYKKSKDKFYEYVTNVIYNTLVTSIIYGILALGVLLISLIFNYLIYESYKIILILALKLV